MFDGFDSGEYCASHSFSCCRMSCDRNVRTLRCLNNEFNFIQRESWCSTLSSPAIVSVDLDPVGAMSDLIADDTSQTVDAVGFFGALWNTPFRSVALWSITARRHYCPGRDDHARSGNDSLLHGLLESNIGVARAFSTKISN